MNFKQRVANQELKGRDKAINLFGAKIELTESTNRYDSWDLSGSTVGIIGTKESNFFIELKDRDYASDDFKSDFLELSKFHNLLDVEPNANHYYLCFFTDGVYRLYKLDGLKLQDVDIKTSLFPSDMDKTYLVEKLAVFLPTKIAIKQGKIN